MQETSSYFTGVSKIKIVQWKSIVPSLTPQLKCPGAWSTQIWDKRWPVSDCEIPKAAAESGVFSDQIPYTEGSGLREGSFSCCKRGSQGLVWISLDEVRLPKEVHQPRDSSGNQ